MVLHDRGVIFIGYGGADRGILKLLNELPGEALPFGAYWVHPNEPHGSVREWLSKRQGVWVRSGWFDEVMLLIRNELALPHPSGERFSRIFQDYQQKFQQLSNSIQEKPPDEAGVQALQKAVIDTEALFPNFWKVISEAGRMQRRDSDRADEIYRQGIKLFPNEAPLLGSYANFLSDIRKDNAAAESMYERALEADPKHATNLGNYAIFLKNERKDNDAAESMYKRALEADPKHATHLGNYEIFLMKDRTDNDGAESMYKRALEADPKHANNLGNYATFLRSERKDNDAAESMYKRALEADPKHATNLGNYAIFLQNERKDNDAAESMYKRALEADPKHANNLGNYAIFLQNERKDNDAAESMYKRALEADPENANHYANLARLLLANGKPEGLVALDRAFQLLRETEQPQVELECEFYGFAHGPVPGRTAALRNLRRLLDQGVRSPGWDLSRNTDRALLEGHPEGPWLPKLAAVINGDAQPELLSGWPAWNSAAASCESPLVK